MPLQSSGAISFVNIQTEFGGVNPIGINEYYLNGAYTTGSGAAGIPTSGQISISQFYGKSKIISSAWAPFSAVESTYSNFGLPAGVGNTGYFCLTGASGTNLTRTSGSTFNNLNSTGINRAGFINYQNLILQAIPGDVLSFQISSAAAYSGYPIINTVYINLGAGWFNAGSISQNYARIDTINYTLPASTVPGNYGIAIFSDWWQLAYGSYSSANFYSLHVVRSYAPIAIQSDYNIFGRPWGTQDTYYLWQNGASGTNTSRTTGSTFNNLGSDGQNRASFINYQNLILQAKPGDNLSFQLRNGAISTYQIANSLLLHLGGGWFVVSSITANGARTDTITYTVPSTTAPGNYGILVYCDYWGANNGYYASANFYSLHIAN